MREKNEEYLKELGFNYFEHGREKDRDGKLRMCWMQVVKNEIVCIRIVWIDNKWIVDHLSPDHYWSELKTIDEVISFVKFD